MRVTSFTPGSAATPATGSGHVTTRTEGVLLGEGEALGDGLALELGLGLGLSLGLGDAEGEAVVDAPAEGGADSSTVGVGDSLGVESVDCTGGSEPLRAATVSVGDATSSSSGEGDGALLGGEVGVALCDALGDALADALEDALGDVLADELGDEVGDGDALTSCSVGLQRAGTCAGITHGSTAVSVGAPSSADASSFVVAGATSSMVLTDGGVLTPSNIAACVPGAVTTMLADSATLTAVSVKLFMG